MLYDNPGFGRLHIGRTLPSLSSTGDEVTHSVPDLLYDMLYVPCWSTSPRPDSQAQNAARRDTSVLQRVSHPVNVQSQFHRILSTTEPLNDNGDPSPR